MLRPILKLCVFLACLVMGAAAASAQDVPFETRAAEAILIDARTAKVMFEKGADVQIPPASMSKLMTMIMVFEGLKAGRLKMDQEFVISEDAY